MKTSFLVKIKLKEYLLIITFFTISGFSLANNDVTASHQLSYVISTPLITTYDLFDKSKKNKTLISYSSVYNEANITRESRIENSKKIHKLSKNRFYDTKDDLYISKNSPNEEFLGNTKVENKESRKKFESNMKKWLMEISNLDKDIFISKYKIKTPSYPRLESNWDYSFNLSKQKIRIEMAKNLQ